MRQSGRPRLRRCRYLRGIAVPLAESDIFARRIDLSFAHASEQFAGYYFTKVAQCPPTMPNITSYESNPELAIVAASGCSGLRNPTVLHTTYIKQTQLSDGNRNKSKHVSRTVPGSVQELQSARPSMTIVEFIAALR